MSKQVKFFCAAIVGISMILSACKRSETTSTQSDAQAVFTAAAETANAMGTQVAASTPSQAPTDTATPTMTATTAPITPTATLTLTSVPLAGTLLDRAEFVTDVTVPDGSSFGGGSNFTKTWRLKNTGTSSWTTAYTLVFYGGNQMGGPVSLPLTGNVPPGQTVDISVNLTAPPILGQYTSYWILRNPLGQNFGVGINADMPVYALINVTSSAQPSATATSTAATPTLATPATPTTGPSPTASATLSGNPITNFALNVVGNSQYTGACPHIFTFQGQFTLNQDATVTFGLEAGSTPPGYTFVLPSPTTASLKAGQRSATYELVLNSSVSGWAQMHVTTPYDVVSNQVTFSLTCQ